MKSTLLLLLGALGLAASTDAGSIPVYVGTYTGGDTGSRGIHRLSLDLDSGRLTRAGETTEATNPSFLALHPSGRFLYAVNEQKEFDGRPGGAVSAFAIDASGGLRLLNQQSSVGEGPCHIVVDGAGRHVLVANYGGGSTSVLPIRGDGSLEPASDHVPYVGSSVNPDRQRAPHAHAVQLTPDDRFVLVADLGADLVRVHALEDGKLTPRTPAKLAPGAGPRHLAMLGHVGWVINELDSTITRFSWHADAGALELHETVSTLPEDFDGQNSTAEIAVSPNGRFLYGSNRGHDSVAIFAIGEDGALTPVGHESTRGRTPRNFAIDPTGRFLLAANQNSGTIAVFRIGDEGGLAPVGEPFPVPSPVCLLMPRASLAP